MISKPNERCSVSTVTCKLNRSRNCVSRRFGNAVWRRKLTSVNLSIRCALRGMIISGSSTEKNWLTAALKNILEKYPLIKQRIENEKFLKRGAIVRYIVAVFIWIIGILSLPATFGGLLIIGASIYFTCVTFVDGCFLKLFYPYFILFIFYIYFKPRIYE